MDIEYRKLENSIDGIFTKNGPKTKSRSKWKSEFWVDNQFNGSNSTVTTSTSDLDCNEERNNFETLDFRDIEIANVGGDVNVSGMIYEQPSVDPFGAPEIADLKPITSRPITNLTEYLKTNLLGALALNYYKKDGVLTEVYRNRLADVIIEHEIRTSANYFIKPLRLEELADLIVEVFPTENKYTYYVPYQYNSGTKKKELPKGKLYDKLNHYRGLLIEAGLSQSHHGRGEKRKRTDDYCPAVLVSRADLDSPEDEKDEYEENVEWLKNNLDPWSRFRQLWIATSKKRIRNLIENGQEVDYVSQYGALRHVKRGVELIDIDFATVYPGKISRFEEQYDTFEREILNFARKKKRGTELKSILQNIERLEEEMKKVSDSPDPNERVSNFLRDSKRLDVFRLMVLLLPCPPTISYGKGKMWKPSKSEVQNGFILHVKSADEMKFRVAQQKKKILDYGLTVQPFIVVVGEEELECFIRIKDTTYNASSLLQAVDICFKSFYSLQLAYPKESRFPWMVIQRRIYDVRGESDIDFPSLSTFVTSLKISGS